MIIGGTKMTIDQIFLSWSDFFKLILEVLTITLPFGPLVIFLPSSSYLASFLGLLFLFVVLLGIMKIVEKEMFEVLRGMRSGKIWFNKQ
jgi:hypothetical protein